MTEISSIQSSSTPVDKLEALYGADLSGLPANTARPLWRQKQTWKTIATTLASMLLVLAVCEVSARIITIAGRPPRGVWPEFDRKLAIARTSVPYDKPLLFIGGSFAEYAIFPELLRTRLSSKGIGVWPKNLATRDSCVLEHLTMLKAAAQAGKRKPIVFYDLKQQAFQSDQIVNNHSTPAFLRTYIAHKNVGSNKLQDKVQTWLEDNFCLVRDRSFLRDQLFRAFWTVFSFDKAYERRFMWGSAPETEMSEMGTTPNWVVMPADQYAESTRKQRLLWKKKNSKYWSLEWFNVIANYCRENDLPLVLLWLPEYSTGGNAELVRDRELTARYQSLADGKHIWLLDLHHIDNDQTHFIDLAHTNILGSIGVTEWLAKRLLQPDLRMLLEGN